MCVTDRHDMILAVKVALNPNTTNQLTTWNADVKYESSVTHHSNVMANVKVFGDKQMDRQSVKMTNRNTDRQKDRAKTICPDLLMRGIK